MHYRIIEILENTRVADPAEPRTRDGRPEEKTSEVTSVNPTEGAVRGEPAAPSSSPKPEPEVVPEPNHEPLSAPESVPTSDHGEPPRRAASWRTTVEQRRQSLDLDLLRLGSLSPLQVEERAALHAILQDVQKIAEERLSLLQWWWGTQIERAWTKLHEVEERLVDLVPGEELAARAAAVSAMAGHVLGNDDKSLVALEAARVDVAAGRKDATALRSSVTEVMRSMHTASDRDNQEARYLRNRILLGSALTFALSAGILMLQRLLAPTAIFQPNNVLADKPTTYVFVVMTFGAVGALLTAVHYLSRIPSDFSPFNLPIQQALLKLVFGPIAAFVGFALVNTIDATGAVDNTMMNVGVPESMSALVALSVLFGAAQHLVTRYVDRRAGEIQDALTPADKK